MFFDPVVWHKLFFEFIILLKLKNANKIKKKFGCILRKIQSWGRIGTSFLYYPANTFTFFDFFDICYIFQDLLPFGRYCIFFIFILLSVFFQTMNFRKSTANCESRIVSWIYANAIYDMALVLRGSLFWSFWNFFLKLITYRGSKWFAIL